MVNSFMRVLFILLIYLSLLGCASEQIPNVLQANKIMYSTYADDIGFTLNSPTKNLIEVETMIEIDGQIQSYADIEVTHLWIVADHEQSGESFNYYLNLDESHFMGTFTLPFGKGNYEISIRAPNDQSGDQLTYYDVAQFSVVNIDEHIEQVVEYTRFGIENNLEILDIVANDGSVLMTGTVDETYNHEKVLIDIRKGNESEQIVSLINDSEFTVEIPLYFGEGIHDIHIQLHNTEDDYYYSSGMIRIDNKTAKQFVSVETYSDYYTSGVTLNRPTLAESYYLTEQAYTVEGEIDPNPNRSHPIEHIIVTMTYLDEDIDAGYIIPVEDHMFMDHVYFRFGPGEYEVKINVPDYEKSDRSMFYYQSIAKFTHHVSDISDKRDLLPSRGIESDDPTIVEKALEITAGITHEREKAKAIYEYVAKNISYDLKKAEADLFNVGDSALSTLYAGSGICQDYAFLATALLRAVGLEAHYVSGHAGERHAWVEVKVDGEWIEMDPTWGAGYVHQGEFYFQYNENYFDPDPNSFQQTHTREEIMY